MARTDTAPKPADAFASVTSDDVRPGETPAQARARRRTAAKRAEREAAKAATGAGADAPSTAPPTAPTGTASAAPRSPGRPSVKDRRAERATGVVAMVGVAVYALDQYDGQVILDGAPRLGESLAELAETNRSVAKAIDALSGTSAWAGVAVAVWAIAAPIARHHGVFGLDQLDQLDGDPAPVEPVLPQRPPTTVPPGGTFDPTAIRWDAANGARVES